MNGVLIFSGILIVICFIIYVFRKAIVLTTIRLVYGHYSCEFLSTYKKYFVRSPFQYCFRDEFISHLLFVLSKREDIPSYNSQKDIYFENTPYFTEYKEFLQKKGTPYCFNAFEFQHLDFEIKALGYQSFIAGSKSINVFYFMNGLFFMGEYIFKKPETDIKSSLLDYFLGKNDIREDNFYIKDTKNRIIHYYDNGFSVDIKYLTREDKIIIENLKGYYSYITGKKIVMEA